jgi:phosphoserine phosphatase
MGEKGTFISLSAIGLDSPGLVAKITNRVFESGGNIIDVEENCRRGLFSIFLIIDFSASPRQVHEVKETLKAIEGETGLKVVLDIYDEERITYRGLKENHIVTILGEDKPGIIAKISAFFHHRNINIESCKMIARGKFFSMELAIDTSDMFLESGLPRADAIESMKRRLQVLCRELNQSVVIQSEDIYRKGKKLVVFDVESTLIQSPSLKEFMESIEGEVKSVKALEETGGNKMQMLVRHARILKGMPLSHLERFSESLQLNPGTLELIGILKTMGFKIALLSSGFSFFVKKIFEKAGVDYAFSNTFRVDEEGIITGELDEPVITDETKGEILEFIMNLENLRPDQVIAVGDGSIRSHFIENVGLSIAFRPKEETVRTDGFLSGDQIINILYCLGIPSSELEMHVKQKSYDPPSAR